MEVKYYICKHCGNIVEKVKDKGVPVICCGEPMQELKAGVTDAAVEKHVPVYTVEGNYVHVVVGETKHPMLEEHFIEWNRQAVREVGRVRYLDRQLGSR